MVNGVVLGSIAVIAALGIVAARKSHGWGIGLISAWKDFWGWTAVRGRKGRYPLSECVYC